MKKKTAYKPISKNRRANFDYDISRHIIAGIVLSGPEAKSIRNGSLSLKGSFANFKNGELWLNNVHISKYPQAAYDSGYDPAQPRKLLVHNTELQRLIADKQNGQHIVVLSVGLMGRYIKAELGIGQSKKLHDKRQTIKARNQRREAQKAISNANRN